MLTSCSLIDTSSVDKSIFPVRLGEKWGYIDKKGQFRINPQFLSAQYFYDGLAMVEVNSHKIGYINKKGMFVIPAQYVDGTCFREGKAFVVQSGGYPVCIDKHGKTIFSLKTVENVFCFSGGMAKFAVKNKKGELKYGFVNEKGESIIKPQYDDALSFSEGLADVRTKNKWGFVNNQGNMVIPPQFEHVSSFHDGLASFRVGNMYGYIDKNGKYLITPQFELAGDFCEGMACFVQGNMVGYINNKGKIVINPQFDESDNFSNQLARFELNEKVGFIDKSAQQKIPAQFDNARNFFGNVAFVQLGDKWGLIDKKGKYLVGPQFDEVGWREDLIYGDNVVNSIFCVKTQYYDVSKSISLLLKEYRMTETSFDGFDANTTLQDIVNGEKYGDYAECYGNGLDPTDEDNRVVSIVDEKLIRGFYELSLYSDNPEMLSRLSRSISSRYVINQELFVLPIAIYFQNPICSRKDYSSSKEYIFDEKISSVIYLIAPITETLEDKGKAIKEELKKQIAEKLHTSFKEIAIYNELALDAAFTNKVNVAIMNQDEDLCLMIVGFDKYSQNLIEKWAKNIEEIEELFDIIDY